MVRRVERQYRCGTASGDASGASGSATIRGFVWVVEHADTFARLRIGVAAFATLLPQFALLRHRFSGPYLGRGDTPPVGIPMNAAPQFLRYMMLAQRGCLESYCLFHCSTLPSGSASDSVILRPDG